MCIIAVKPKGAEMPSKASLQRCEARNPNGSGFAIRRNGKIIVSKGFFHFKTLMDKLDDMDIKKDEEAIIHFRIATSGEVNLACCHPFPVTEDEKFLVKDEYEADLVVAHNGIISEYPGDDKLSDTMMFIMQVLAKKEIQDNIYESTVLQDLIKNVIGWSKLAFLHKDKGIMAIGDFEEHKGCFFSNDGYKTARSLFDANVWTDDFDYNAQDARSDYFGDEDFENEIARNNNICSCCGFEVKYVVWNEEFKGYVCPECDKITVN